MPATQTQTEVRIDEWMEQASRRLVERDYFEAERLCVMALRKAMSIRDYDRVSRIVLPLQEARRQKRDLAFDAGSVFLVDDQLPEAQKIKAGCYLVCPPRVGVDGRALRDAADERRVPIIVLVREPATKEGLWPLVAVGPMTVRARVQPHRVAAPKPPKPAKAAKGTSKKGAPAAVDSEDARGEETIIAALPPPEWFLSASEALGDAAIASAAGTSPEALVEAFMIRLDAHPDHEKLHQRLADAAREAARNPARKRRIASEYDVGEDGAEAPAARRQPN